MKKVFIGVGHGGSDPGAIGNGFKEKDLNLSIAVACKDVLERHGVEVLMSRYTDENDSIKEEIKECNATSPLLAIDIHNNAGGGDGFEAYYHFKGGLSKTLAENIEGEVIKLGQNSRGCKTKIGNGGVDYYGFIRETVCPAIVLECCFVDNEKDITILDTTEEQRKFGEAIAKGILRTLGIIFQEEIVSAEVAAKKIQEKCGFENKTMEYLWAYKYGKDLMLKLWKAMN